MNKVYDKVRHSDKPVVVTKEDYYYALEALPPIYGKGFFACSEPVTHTDEGHPTYFCYCKSNGKHYAFHGTMEQARTAFSQLKLAA